MTDRCVLEHKRDPDRPRRPVEGTWLCYGHLVHGLGGDLADLPALDRRLTERHNPSGRGGAKTSGTRDLGLRYDDRVGYTHGELYTSLAGWCRVVAEEGRWWLPEDDVASMSAWLLGSRGSRLRWTASRPWVDEYAEDVRRVAHEAYSLAYPSGRRRVDVGPCTRDVACDVATRVVQRCTGTLRATVHDQDDLLPAELVCDECTWPVPPREWVTLGRRLGRAGTMLTAVQLSGLWDTPVGTIQRWAHDDRWRRDGGYPMRYDADQAEETYKRMRPDGASAPEALLEPYKSGACL